jgi:hypothetical protein
MNKGEFKISIGRVNSSRGDDFIRVEVTDDVSGTRVFEGRMSLTAFAACITGHAYISVDGEIGDFDKIGKKYVGEKRSAVLPAHLKNNYSSDEGKKAIIEWLRAEKAEEGWEIRGYLGSRDSFTYLPDNERAVNYTVYKYVAPEELLISEKKDA